MNTTFTRYFSEYLGTDLTSVNAGEIVVAGTPRRMQPEYGWGYTVLVWLFRVDGVTVVSTHPAVVEKIKRVIDAQHDTRSMDDLMQLLDPIAASMGLRRHYVYTASEGSIQPIESPHVRHMTMQDIDAFIDMSRAMYPEIDVECETNDIMRNIADGIAFGAFADERMVTRSYAPHIAHMQDRVEEIGIETLAGYRNRGFASAALAGSTIGTLARGRLPIYRVSIHNDVSIRLAERVGYQRVAESVEWVA